MKSLEMHPKVLLACAWCGPVLVLFFFIGLVPLAGFIPPPDPSAGSTEIADMYRNDIDTVRAGLLMATISVGLFLPWGAAIAVLTRRAETGFPVLSYTQVASIGVGTLVAVLTCLVWSAAAFRPDEISPETTRMLNDVGWFLYLYTWPPFSVWAVAIAIAIFIDRRETPAFPRWAAYLNLWVAFLLVPAGLMLFFKDGAFAFNGLITFWVPTVAFFGWVVVMTALVIRAVQRHERATEAAAPGTPGSQKTTPPVPVAGVGAATQGAP